MCPALSAGHCGYIKRATCPRAGEEDLKDTEESVPVGEGQNRCCYRETVVWHWLGSKAIVVRSMCNSCADMITAISLELDTKAHV